ncbi:hypothetical protein yc1106_03042 [Curvularia clavata]|uniref:Subtelomeric hrmA-associated cluster protein AFUB-079030/YDR124W-like helical bundle domain-containing protein n=1 Tax=Curvularia clavata TaxID=95742 RepID=A0A9Q8Z8H6_CURCL|nr:hypothetical protein yc1106_03042 [Curvularia clavata]
MARSRPAGQPNGQRPLRLKYGGAMETHEYSDDPWTNGGIGGANSSCLAEGEIIKQDETGEKFAIPTPIAQSCWKVISPDGHEQLCYEPIPGFEHLCSGSTPLQGTPCSDDSPKSPLSQPHQPIVSSVPSQTLDGPKAERNPRKRSQSSEGTSFSQSVAEAANYEEENGQYSTDVKITTEQSYTFYIGDIAELKKFFRRRLDELTMKPLRPIVTAWIKQLEPKRLSHYGPYHKRFPRELPSKCTPPWWPSDVRYEEPSHLDKAGLLNLAVDIMLQHRLIDKEKRKGSWVAKLRQTAQYAVETTPPDQFSSSKGSGFSERMQSRALAEILPNLFETAQLFEDHLAYHGHYEGSGIPDPGIGKRVTWQPLTRPARKPVTSRKRPRRTKTDPGSRLEIDTDVSGYEAEMDDSTSSSYLPDEQLVSERIDELNDSGPMEAQQQGLASTHEPGAAPLQTCPFDNTTTSIVSFGQSVYEYPLGDKMDLDVKTATPTPLQNHIHANASHIVLYSTSNPSYDQHAVESQQESCAFLSTSESTFAPNSASVYHHPFSAFDTHFAQSVEHMAFHNDTCYPHGHEAYAPSSVDLLDLFQATPNSASTNCQANASPY